MTQSTDGDMNVEEGISTKKSRPVDKNDSDDERASAKENVAQTRAVVIGASAGGLEALEELFDAMPPNIGVAFIIVQHLSPDFTSMMDQLMARHTSMRLETVKNGTVIQPNTVYLNLPRSDMSISNGRLNVKEETNPNVAMLPIDRFMISLAEDQGDQSIGIILSGTGSDGTKGAAEILNVGGTMIVQEPSSAKFDSMPRNAIEKGLVSLVVRPKEMPELIGNISKNLPIKVKPDDVEEDDRSPEDKIIIELNKRYGADFSYYKISTVHRRIMRRAQLNQSRDLSAYYNYLREHSEELEALFCDILIGVTSFFRDREAYDALEELVLPDLMKKMSKERQLRIWVAGCASGQEAYSIAILMSEYARCNGYDLNLKIFATDIHFNSLDIAGAGQYQESQLSGLDDEIIDRYFSKFSGGYHVTQALRKLIVFSPHNLIKDPPFTRIDLITCRNLLIYLDDVAQKKVLALFHFSLNKDGYLFLGPSETTGDIANEFITLDKKWRINRKRRDVKLAESTRLLPSKRLNDKHSEVSNLGVASISQSGDALHSIVSNRRVLNIAYDTILSKYAPPSFLVDFGGELIHIFGEASKYISLETGFFSKKLVDIIHKDLKLSVTAGLERGASGHASPYLRDVTVQLGDESEIKSVSITIEPLSISSNVAEYFLVHINEKKIKDISIIAPETKKSRQQNSDNDFLHDRVSELERDLRFTEESLQSTIEELETSNEELQATNEELMASNEELQSTNEELHSVNEELYTVSAEHQRKIQELTELTNDMDNLLKSTNIGTIFLDEELKIRRFTPAAAETFNLIDHDIKRPIEHITFRFHYDALVADLTEVRENKVIKEHEIIVSDHRYLIRMLPYYDEFNDFSGVVITVIDINDVKKAEQKIRLQNEALSRANDNLEQFAQIVAHDLKAPLRSIRHTASWIEEDLADTKTAEIEEHLARLVRQANHLSDLLSALLDYSQTDFQHGTVSEIDVEKLIRDNFDMVESNKKHELKIYRTLPIIKGYSVPLSIVVRNLIENALKYNDLDSAIIAIKSEENEDKYIFTIEDNGPGIALEQHEKIFLPFRKLEHSSIIPGTGIGLAIVKKIIQSFGGDISVISDPTIKRGTAFRFSWPKKPMAPNTHIL